MAKKWQLEGTIRFFVHDFESDAEDALGALEDLVPGLFDYATCAIKLNEEHCRCEEVDD